ncbi:hypothetical protein QBC36DRAFT_376449 [Triangularia setosa]|uniref:Uncharacterized protein n=1 Tax=Triangularia setosa TaxID=2587417 RepID=A0AAN6WBB4_9PEZI|nr:hypothetical protein QBC36DRAFT_376449 [Podospora setosa]
MMDEVPRPVGLHVQRPNAARAAYCIEVVDGTATASRRKKHNQRAKGDRRRSDRPERSIDTRNTKERSHDHSRHTEAIEKPLDYAGKQHFPDDRADPSERVRAWVQRTQNRHPHRSLLTAPDSDERLRRTSPPTYRGTDIIRGKKRGRSVSRSLSVSLEHGFGGGKIEPRFKKRHRHKTHEDKYEYKGGTNRKQQPIKERSVEPEQEVDSRNVIDCPMTNRAILRAINTEERMTVLDNKSGRADETKVNRHHPQANYALDPQHSSSSSRFLENHHHSGNRSLILPSRSSRQYASAHPREAQYDLGQDGSYSSSSSITGTVAYEQRRKHQHSTREPKQHEQRFPSNGWPGTKSMNHQKEQIIHRRPSVEKHSKVSPPVQLVTPLAKDSSRRRDADHVPPASQYIVTLVLPRYKDVETQTDPSLLNGLLKDIADAVKTPDQPSDIATQVCHSHEIQKRIQLLPDSPYPKTKRPLTNGIKHEYSHQHHEPPSMNAQIYPSEQAGKRRYPEEPKTPYMEDIYDFIRRIEEEDIGELSDALAAEDDNIPAKTEEYNDLEELEHECANTIQDGERR